MRFISWNVGKPGRERIGKQVAALCARKPDVIALQEVTPQAADAFRQQFENEGFHHVADSFPRCGKDALKRGRQFGELLASKFKLRQISSAKSGVRWHEKILSVVVDTDWGEVEIHTVHIPNGSNHGRVKIETFETIYKRLAVTTNSHRILCGDFNTPQEETPDGRIITWGQTKNAAGAFVIGKGRWDRVSSERWDLAERSVLEGLRRYDLSDLFREIHGYRTRNARAAFSYYNNHGRSFYRRFDHIYASASLNGIKCGYLYQASLRQLSDHAPIEAEFQPDRH